LVVLDILAERMTGRASTQKCSSSEVIGKLANSV